MNKTADKYAVKTLKAEKIIELLSGGEKPVIDFSDNEDFQYRRVLKQVDDYNVNALFFQLATVIKDELKSDINKFNGFLEENERVRQFSSGYLFAYMKAEDKESYYEENKEEMIESIACCRDFIGNHLFFIDCKQIFEKKDGDAKEKDIGKLKYIFTNGVEIKFSDKVSKRFLPFDKSNSMARRSKISFIREDVKKKIEERLLLGYSNKTTETSDPNDENGNPIPPKSFDDIMVVPSKFYAYRGLYLTDSYRIEDGTADKYDVTLNTAGTGFRKRLYDFMESYCDGNQTENRKNDLEKDFKELILSEDPDYKRTLKALKLEKVFASAKEEYSKDNKIDEVISSFTDSIGKQKLPARIISKTVYTSSIVRFIEQILEFSEMYKKQENEGLSGEELNDIKIKTVDLMRQILYFDGIETITQKYGYYDEILDLKNQYEKSASEKHDICKTVTDLFNLIKESENNGRLKIVRNRIEMKLNENTVIVIRDGNKTLYSESEGHNPVSLFGDETDRILESKKKSGDNKDIEWKFARYQSKAEGIKVNPFDGEGLISPDYAEFLNRRLLQNDNAPYQEESTSFQIRMPFTKGMLHTVDFHAFINEYYGNEDSEDTELYIEDIYGIKRKLKDAQIILTDNLFKGSKWFRNLNTKDINDNSEETDPMKEYFHRFNHYNHALYVGNTDDLLDRKNRTRETTLNYQFISTLDIDKEKIGKLVDHHFEKIENYKETIKSQYRNNSRKFSDCEDDGDGLTADDVDYTGDDLLRTGKSGPYIALANDDSFRNDIRVRSSLQGVQRGMAKNAGLGRLVTKGECRFLSGDLLGFMKDNIADQLFIKAETGEYTKFNAVKDNLKNEEGIHEDRFYMPSQHIVLDSKFVYAILRNPHLSRNEQCALRPFIPEQSENQVYYKYFRHLKGIVMISDFSLVASALSGADFDGDLVKIYSDKILSDAIVGSCYDKSGDCLRRKNDMPIVVIPNTKESFEKYNTIDIEFNTIKNTFSNRVGFISNLAVKAGKEEYANKNKAFENYCAQLTALTGLEIDAAKTGVHPTKNVDEIADNLKKIDSDFIKVKDSLKNITPGAMEIRKDEDGFVRLDVKKIKNGAKGKSEIYCFDNSEYVLDLLEMRFAERGGSLYDGVLKDVTPKERNQHYAHMLNIPCFEAKKKFYEDDIEGLKALCRNLQIDPADLCKENRQEPEKETANNLEEIIKAVNEKLAETEYTHEWVRTKKAKDNNESGKLDAVKALMRAYNEIFIYEKNVNDFKRKLENSKYRSCVFTLLKIQYGSLDAKLSPETGDAENNSVKKICESAYTYIFDKLNNSAGNAEEALKRFIESNWAFTDRVERNRELFRILTGDIPNSEEEKEIDENKAVYDLMTNFRFNGYRLLYYAIKTCFADSLGDSENIDEYCQRKPKKEKTEKQLKYEAHFRDIFNKKWENRSEWVGDVNDYCRKEVFRIIISDDFTDKDEYMKKHKNYTVNQFAGDVKKTFSYIFYNHTSDPKGNFLWDVMGSYYVGLANLKGDKYNA